MELSLDLAIVHMYIFSLDEFEYLQFFLSSLRKVHRPFLRLKLKLQQIDGHLIVHALKNESMQFIEHCANYIEKGEWILVHMNWWT